MGQINIFVALGAFGLAAGLLTVMAVALFGVLVKRRGLAERGPYVPKTLAGGLGIGNVMGPGALLARAGQNAPTRMTLGTVVMTPTRGLRFISLGGSALILFMLWTPSMLALFSGLTFHVLLTGALGYAAIFISGYEVRYDADGVTAPNFLFVDQHHPWEEFISIRDNGHYLYQLRFENGRMSLQKYLVGMPTFLTFVTEIRKMQTRR